MSRVSVDWTELVGNRKAAFIPVLRGVLAHLGGLHTRVVAVIALGFASAIAELITLALLVPIYDLVAGRDQPKLFDSIPAGTYVQHLYALPPNARVIWIVSLLFGCAILREVLNYANALVCARVQLRLNERFRNAVFRRAFSMRLADYHAVSTGNHYHMLTTFSQMAADFTFAAIRAVVPGTLIATYIAVLVYLSPELTLVVALVSVASLFGAHLVLRKLRVWAAKSAAYLSAMNRFALETLSAMRAIRLMGREHAFYGRNTGKMSRWIDIAARTAAYQAAISPLNQLSASAALFAVVLGGAIFLQGESVDWLQFVLFFLIVMSRMSGPIGALNSLRGDIAYRVAGADFLLEFLRNNPDRIPEPAQSAKGIAGDITLEDVRFAYAPGDPEVLRGISMHIPKGGIVALVGRSGAGKSTLLDLICRISSPTAGRIACGGVDIASIPERQWRAEIAVVSQTPFLFDASLRDNIRIARPQATDSEVAAAARLANMDEFVSAMPQGYDTWVGERGVLLSGGQAQRVAIARAVLSEPSLLILDEATSAQDAESEAAIQSAIDQLSESRTVIVVAHRLATVMKAQTIFVLDEGRIVEQGEHRELIQRGGLYSRFVELQDLGREGRL